MPRVTVAKQAELEAFWRAHLKGWRESELNQREYCERHGLPLKRFGNWRAKYKDEDPHLTGHLLYRRGGLRHMASHMSKDIPPAPASYIPSARSSDQGRRRNFSEADKRRIVEEARQEGASLSGVARKYDIDTRLLFRWRKAQAPPEQAETIILPVTLTDTPDLSGVLLPGLPEPTPAPVIVERATPGIEVELVGGRRVSSRPVKSLPTTRRSRFLIRNAVERVPGGYGSMREMTGHGAARIHRRPFTSTALTAEPSDRRRI